MPRFSRFFAPVCATGGGVEGFAPDEADATCRSGELGDLGGGDGGVELGEEGGGEGVFGCGEVGAGGEFGFGAFRRAGFAGGRCWGVGEGVVVVVEFSGGEENFFGGVLFVPVVYGVGVPEAV